MPSSNVAAPKAETFWQSFYLTGVKGQNKDWEALLSCRFGLWFWGLWWHCLSSGHPRKSSSHQSIDDVDTLPTDMMTDMIPAFNFETRFLGRSFWTGKQLTNRTWRTQEGWHEWSWCKHCTCTWSDTFGVLSIFGVCFSIYDFKGLEVTRLPFLAWGGISVLFSPIPHLCLVHLFSWMHSLRTWISWLNLQW